MNTLVNYNHPRQPREGYRPPQRDGNLFPSDDEGETILKLRFPDEMTPPWIKDAAQEFKNASSAEMGSSPAGPTKPEVPLTPAEQKRKMISDISVLLVALRESKLQEAA